MRCRRSHAGPAPAVLAPSQSLPGAHCDLPGPAQGRRGPGAQLGATPLPLCASLKLLPHQIQLLADLNRP